MSPSTRSTRQRRPRASVSGLSCRTDHAVPRSSAFPTAPGGTSSSSTATSPTNPTTAVASGDCSHASRRRRNSSSEPTESSEKRSNWNQTGSVSPKPARAPTTSAPRPKNRMKKPPGVSISKPRRPRPASSQTHHSIAGSADAGARGRRLGLGGGLRLVGRLARAAAQALDDVERDRNDEDGDQRGGEHPAHHAGAEDAARHGAG